MVKIQVCTANCLANLLMMNWWIRLDFFQKHLEKNGATKTSDLCFLLVILYFLTMG